MQTPREIIAQTLEKSFYMLTYDELAADLLSGLTAAGYRLVGPLELDAETVERCIDGADAEAKRCADASNASSGADLYRHNTAFHSASNIAAAIRALSQESKP